MPKSQFDRIKDALPRGETIRYLEDRKRYEIRFRVNGKQRSVRGATPADAKAELDRVRGELAVVAERSSRLAKGNATVAEMFADWLRFHGRLKVGPQGSGVAPSTLDSYHATQRHLESTGLWKLIASAVIPGDVMDAYLEIAERGRAGEPMFHKIRVHLGMAFDHGVNKGYVVSNPSRGVKTPGGVRPGKRKIVHLDFDTEFAPMRSYLSANPTGPHVAILVGLLTGLRPGEVLGLRWTAVHLDGPRPYIDVASELQRSQGGRVLTPVDMLKTEQSERGVELTGDLVTALRWWKVEQARMRLAAKQWTDTGLVFTRDDGRSMRFDSLRGQCHRACVAAGVTKVSPGKLRHSNATALLAMGMTHADVAKHLGNSPRMVVEHYGRASKAALPMAQLFAEG